MSAVAQQAADLIVTTNGPGEIAGWFTPVVRALRETLGGDDGVLRVAGWPLRLFAWLLPCNFASGGELKMVEALGPFDGIFTPGELWGMLLRGRRPHGYVPGARGLVLFLGGDLFYGAAIARRLGFDAMAYTEGRARWFWAYRHFFVPNAAAAARARRAGAPEGRVHVVGELVVDAVRGRAADDGGAVAGEPAPPLLAPPRPAPLRVALFPGSRDYELRWVLPLLARAAGEMARRWPGPVVAQVGVSPFAPDGLAQDVLASARAAAGSSRLEYAVADGPRLARPGGCDVALTVPGTITAELAAAGIPMVTVLPLNRPDLIPLEGIPGLLGRLPVAGAALKRRVIRRALPRVGFVALPNRRAGRRLVPEVVGEHITPEAVAEAALQLLQEPEPARQARREGLRAAMGPAGAARQVVARLQRALAGEAGT